MPMHLVVATYVASLVATWVTSKNHWKKVVPNITMWHGMAKTRYNLQNI
jgi:hypothetical protein